MPQNDIFKTLIGISVLIKKKKKLAIICQLNPKTMKQMQCLYSGKTVPSKESKTTHVAKEFFFLFSISIFHIEQFSKSFKEDFSK